MTFFAVENLGVRFGGVVAVDGVSFALEQGEVYTIIGPNGAGKTTIFNLIGLIYPPTSGRILFRGREVKARRITSPRAASRARSRTSSCSSMRPCCRTC
jgi:branched-chain amino acid transport system ATP-binding protein